MNKITYEHFFKHGLEWSFINIMLDDELSGRINPINRGFQYRPFEAGVPSKIFPTVIECKRYLEGTNEISNKLEIGAYLHCRKCFAEKPADITPRAWAKNEVGWTEKGLQVWCIRHECNVINIDFEGVKHHANQTVSAATPYIDPDKEKKATRIAKKQGFISDDWKNNEEI